MLDIHKYTEKFTLYDFYIMVDDTVKSLAIELTKNQASSQNQSLSADLNKL